MVSATPSTIPLVSGPSPSADGPARLEDLSPGAKVRGVLTERAVTVVQVEWHGTQALTLTYRDDAGHASTTSSSTGATRPARDRGRGARLELRRRRAALPPRLRGAAHPARPPVRPATWRCTPRTSTRCPHQIRAVYGEMLPRQPLRFLLADDPGAGKTIMAGLFIKELIVRGDVERCLIVAPGSLVEQWQDELWQSSSGSTSTSSRATRSRPRGPATRSPRRTS